ncbi:MAG TPA: Crp/Fnr family transcriptional regulator, partial [Pseudogracilibacillus sp.]|nr:Crp/Fnr family transcriptional regulator [Pseudogracilibacillus sp.]
EEIIMVAANVRSQGEGGRKGRACVSLVPIFNHLTVEQMDEIMEVVHTHPYKKGQLIYRAEETSDALYIVNRGRVKMYRLAESGKEQLLRLLSPGDFTGELALFKQSVQEVYAEALVDSEICQIRGDDLQDLLLRYPTISLKILTEFARRLEASEKQATSFATEKVDTRIAVFLAECVTDDEVNEALIELPMTRKDLASYLGTTPETMSRKLTEFESLGLISQKGARSIYLYDIDQLLLL